MTVAQTHGTLVEPTVLVIQRWLPGPIERVWAYLTQSELRRQWLASGEMPLEADAPFELVWRNDELSDPPGVRPDGAAWRHGRLAPAGRPDRRPRYRGCGSRRP